jgi:large subunit ribosomal protein L10
MAISKSKKGEIVSDVSKILADSKTVVFLQFHGITVGEVGEVRRALRAAGVGYRVAKKSLIKRALTDAGVTGELPNLEGEVALISGADLLAPAREILEFTKKFKEKLTILGGVFDGMYKSKAEMLTIASIPGIKTLQAQFVQLINSPIQRFVLALNAIAEKKG